MILIAYLEYLQSQQLRRVSQLNFCLQQHPHKFCFEGGLPLSSDTPWFARISAYIENTGLGLFGCAFLFYP